MYIGFPRFLVALVFVGVAMGLVFGSGVAVGRGKRAPQTLAASTAGGAGAAVGGGGSGAGTGAGAGGGLGAALAGGGADGAGIVNGQVDSITQTSLVVKTANGQNVTLTVNAQTAVRKTDSGTLADVHAGDQVLVSRDASAVATNVQVVPAGGLGLGGRGANGGAGAAGSATPGAGGGQRGGGTPTPTR